MRSGHFYLVYDKLSYIHFYHNPLIFNYKFIFALLRAQILQYYEAKQKGNKNVKIFIKKMGFGPSFFVLWFYLY